jgi:plasmid maintenance system antidote protein VapI
MGGVRESSPEVWLNLQQSYDLSNTRIEEEKQIMQEVHARLR